MKPILARALVPLVSLVLLGCAGSTTAAPTDPPAAPPLPRIALGQPFELPLGTSLTVADTGLEVLFRSVPEDSRCPRMVSCVWAGRATVELQLSAPDTAPETVMLSTCCAPNDQKQHVYAGQTIDLQGLTPAPERPGAPIADYRVALVVSST